MRVSASLQTTFLRSHYIISPAGYRHDGEEAFLFFIFLCRFSGRDGEEMYIHFMVISQKEKCTFAAGALALVPIGLKTIAWPS